MINSNLVGEITEIDETIETIEKVINKSIEQIEDLHDLMVFNDDFNTFDHVIETLMKVCKHESHQAEQCAYIIHYNGKCSVKKGAYTKLRPMKEAIIEAGINAAIV